MANYAIFTSDVSSLVDVFDGTVSGVPTATSITVQNNDGTITVINGVGLTLVGGVATAGTVTSYTRTTDDGLITFEVLDGLDVNNNSFVTFWNAANSDVRLSYLTSQNDTQTGASGDDIMIAGTGLDDVDAGDGDDYVFGEAGNDTITGGQGADNIYGGVGNDTLYSGHNTTSIFNEEVYGGSGDDTIGIVAAGFGRNSAMTIYGDQDNGLAGPAVVDGNDTIDVSNSDGTGTITIFGNGGNDIITTGSSVDNVDAGTGDDLVIGGSDNDVLNGGADIDTIDYRNSAAVIVTLATGQVSNNQLINTISNFENVNGSGFGDLLVGDAVANVINGGGGGDIIDGGNGSDTIDGGLGNDTIKINGGISGYDTIDGGAGSSDRLDLSGVTSKVWVDIEYGASTTLVTNKVWTDAGAGWVGMASAVNMEDVTGSGFGDSLFGSAGVNQIDGGAGADYLYGRGENDSLNGGSGNDRIYGGTGDDNLTGGTGDDILYGDDNNDTFIYVGNDHGRDTVVGGAGTDTFDLSGMSTLAWVDLMYGSEKVWAHNGTSWVKVAQASGVENITGTAFADTIKGDNGANTIIGGAGNDLLTGRGGADRFEFNALVYGRDTVTDFVDSTDVLAFTSNVADALSDFSISGNNTNQVTLTLIADPTQQIVLKGVAPITIDNLDFVWMT